MVEWIAQRSGDEFPQNAIRGGQEADGQPFFVARAKMADGSVHPGKCGSSCGRGGLIGYGDKEVYSGEYELLTGDQNSVKWVDASGPLQSTDGLIDGGRDGEGNPLFVSQTDHEGGVFVGKASQQLDGSRFGYGGAEQKGANYRVLANA